MSEVQISVKEYRGKDPQKLEQYRFKLTVARDMERYLTEKKRNSETDQCLTVSCEDIARAISAPLDTVKELVSYTKGPSSGFTY